MELFSLIGLVGALAAALGGIALFLRMRRRGRGPSTATLVRKRNALRDELRELIPDKAELDRIVQAEARRLRVGDTSLQAYESAVERVKAKQTTPPQNTRQTP